MLIAMAGLPGSGKSTLARGLAAQRGRPFRLIVCVCADETACRRLERGVSSHLAGNRDYGRYLAN